MVGKGHSGYREGSHREVILSVSSRLGLAWKSWLSAGLRLCLVENETLWRIFFLDFEY